jgi:hypothetical protein
MCRYSESVLEKVLSDPILMDLYGLIIYKQWMITEDSVGRGGTRDPLSLKIKKDFFIST